MIDIEDVKRLRLADGDILVVKVGAFITLDQVKHIKAMVADCFPASAGRVMVLDKSMSLAVLEAGAVAGLDVA